MKKITLLSIMIIISSISMRAQQVVVQNFELPAAYNLNIFAGLVGSIVPDPVVGGTRGNNLKLTSSSAGEVYQGCELIQLVNKIKLITDKTVKIDVYSSVTFTLLAKVEGGSGAPNSGASQSYTTPNAWQTLTFTFTQGLDGTATANGSYSSLVLFPNWNPTNSGFLPATNFSINVDNIVSEATPIAPPAQPTTAAPTPPARPVADVKSIFSNAYAPIATLNYSGVDGQPSNDNTYNTSWSPANTTLVSVAGNDTNRVTGLGFEGVAFLAGRINATTFTNFHMDIWTEFPTQDKSFNIKFSNWNNGTAEANAIEFVVSNANFLTNPNPGWISLDIPLSSFIGINGAGRNDLAQFIITSDLGTVFYDNLYLHKNTILVNSDFKISSSVKFYPTLTSKYINIESDKNIDKVVILNLLGQEVLSFLPNTTFVLVDIETLKSGIYIAQVLSNGIISSNRILKR